jgi:hypothetical protein
MLDEPTTTIESEVSEFIERHRACSKARPFAARFSTLADGWDSCHVPDWLIWCRKKAGFEDLQALRVWACWCVRQTVHLMSQPETSEALDVVERFIEGNASAEELAAVAGPAARLGDASFPTAAEAWAARAAAELTALRPVHAARAAAEALAWASEARSAWPAVRLAQCDKLRELIHPQCKGGPGPDRQESGIGNQETGVRVQGPGVREQDRL